MQVMIAAVVLVGVLGFAVVRPWRLPEVVAAAPAAGVVLVLGLVSVGGAWDEVRALGPTVGFLAAILVLAHLADVEGVFRYAGDVAARVSRGSPRRLLVVVFGIAATVTAALSLDATVVLLTPVVFATAAAVRVPARPHVYACTHLANSASLLLPVSNLTNLLAFSASGLSFGRFTGLMVLPWLAVIAVEYGVFTRFFSADLAVSGSAEDVVAGAPPRFAIVVLALTLVGFGVAQPFGVHPAVVASVGAVVLIVARIVRRREGTGRALWDVVVAANVGFCAFVLALGVVVLALRQQGLDGAVAHLVPSRADLWGLLVTAAIAAVLANLLNNLPATLVLVPAVAHHPGLVLAVLIGVNVGPNLTYVGSLATLLWRHILHARDARPDGVEFLRLGALTVPAGLVAGVGSLWLSLHVL